jgi:hypothetical protein
MRWVPPSSPWNPNCIGTCAPKPSCIFIPGPRYVCSGCLWLRVVFFLVLALSRTRLPLGGVSGAGEPILSRGITFFAPRGQSRGILPAKEPKIVSSLAVYTHSLRGTALPQHVSGSIPQINGHLPQALGVFADVRAGRRGAVRAHSDHLLKGEAVCLGNRSGLADLYM